MPKQLSPPPNSNSARFVRRSSQVCGSYVIQFSPKPGAPEVEVDFTPPFKRISMISGLEEVMKIKLPALDDPNCDKVRNCEERSDDI